MRLQALPACARHCPGTFVACSSSRARTAVVTRASGQQHRESRGSSTKNRDVSLSQANEAKHGFDSSERVASSQALPLNVGTVVTGEVLWSSGSGAKVQLILTSLPDISPVQAWLPTRQISQAEDITSAQEVFEVGDEVTAVILSVKRDERGSPNVIIGTKQLEVQPGDMLTNREAVAAGAEERAALWLQEKDASMQQRETEVQAALASLEPGDVVVGNVAQIKPYGAFVRLKEEHRGLTALLHISQISVDRIRSVADVFQPGDHVTAMVLKVDQDSGRLTLSTKKLESSRGDMLRDRALVYDTALNRAAEFKARYQARVTRQTPN